MNITGWGMIKSSVLSQKCESLLGKRPLDNFIQKRLLYLYVDTRYNKMCLFERECEAKSRWHTSHRGTGMTCSD